MNIVPTLWGKDHWSLLIYLECRAVDHQAIQPEKLRCNEARHPQYQSQREIATWRAEYSTRLNDGTQHSGHDDWDCLDDLEAAGMVGLVFSTALTFSLTELGIRTAHRLRVLAINGGQYKDFTWPEKQDDTVQRST